MGVRDALLHNTTGSNFEALQSGDTARIKGDFSIKNTSRTEIFGVDVSADTVNVAGNITSGGNISGSATSTGSFGRVVASTYLGDGKAIRQSLPRSSGLITSSAQIASDISGAFNRGFFFGFQASSSISGGLGITASFGRVEGIEFHGSGTGLQSTLTRSPGLVTSSAQLAADISGSFNKGFDYEGILKGATVTAGGTWSEGGSLIVPRHSGAMAGTQNAAFYIAGNLAQAHGWYGGGNQTCTEEYNGTSWSAGTAFPLDSEGTNLMPLAPAGPDPGNKAGTGAQNAALVFGGQSHYQTPRSTGSAFEYDGTAFTQVASMPEPISCHIGAGTQNATISYGGSERALTSPYADTTAQYANTWDGSTWSNITATLYGRQGHASTPNGTVNSTMAFGATANSPDIKSTECWNGSSWTECPEQNVRRVRMGGSGAPDDAQVFGGQGSYGSNSPTTNGTSEYWNGLSWNTGATMVRAAGAAGDGNAVRGAGTAAAALAAGGYPGAGAYTGTEEYTGLTVGTGSFGRVDAIEFHGSGSGLKDTLPRVAGLVTGSAQLASRISGSFNKGFTFTTTSSLGHATGSLISGQVGAWSVGGNLNTGRGGHNQCTGAGVAAANAVSLFGGEVPGSPHALSANTENYDGVSWSEQGDLTDGGRRDGAGFGTQTAGVYTGGFTNTSTPYGGCKCTEHFNGTNWSEETAFPHNMGYSAGAGTQNAGLVAFGGTAPTPGTVNIGSPYSVEYNGTNWVNASTAADFTPRNAQVRHAMAGIQNAAITVGSGHHRDGAAPYMDDTVMNYNGDSWSVGTPTPGNVKWSSLAGTQNDVLSAGGYAMPQYSYNQVGDYAQRFDGTSWAQVGNLVNTQMAAGGAGLTSYAMTLYGGFTRTPTPTSYIDDTQEYFEGIANLTVDRFKANHITGDGSALSKFIPNLVSGSAQLASDISGSFNKGFEFVGQISGSATSTGSFGQVYSNDFRGDGGGLTNVQLNEGVVSGSAQLADDISGSFNKGFEFTGTIEANRIPNAPSLVGVTSIGASLSTPGGNYSSRDLGMGTSPVAALNVNKCIAESYNGVAWSIASPATPFPNNNAGDEWGAYDDAAFLHSGITYTWDGSSFTTKPSSHNANNTGFPSSAGAGITTDAGLKLDNGGKTECYNGSTWTEVAAMPSDATTQYGMSGTSTAAIKAGGYSPGGVQIWSGDSWSEGASLSTATVYGRHQGTVNAGLFSGGNQLPSGGYNQEEFNGTSWSTGGNLILAIMHHHSLGAGSGGPGGLTWGGSSGYPHSSYIAPGVADPSVPSVSRTLQIYELPNTVTGSFGRVDAIEFHGDGSNIRDSLGRSTGILSSSAQIANEISGAILGGDGYLTSAGHHLIQNGIVSGSIFSTGSFGLLNAKFLKGDGTLISSSIVSSITHITASSEIAAGISASFQSGFESTGNILDQKSAAHSDGVWSGAAPMVGTYHGGAGAGTQNAALHFGGRGPGGGNAASTNTEEWDGTSWSEQDNMLESYRRMAGAGSQNGALSMGGYRNPYSTPGLSKSDVLYYNGNSWAEKADLPAGKYEGIGVGKDADALHIGGGDQHPSTVSTDMDKFSLAGNTWSEETSVPVAVGANSAAGTTEALILGRYHASEGSLVYNGSSWSEVASLIVNRGNGKGMFGTQNDAVNVGGCNNAGANRCCTEIWNGVTWSAGNAMTIGRSLDSGRAQGSPSSAGGGITFSTAYSSTYSAGADSGHTELYNAVEFSNASGSFGLLKPRGGGINTKAFQVTSASLFKLPVFSDKDLNYSSYEGEYNTGSLSGSVDRVADVIVGQNLGEMWFDSDKNAIGYTYQSSSLISQSLSLGTFTNTSASGYYFTSSIGLFTQSFYSHSVVTCYLTGSQI